MLYSGRDADPHHKVVAIILKKGTEKCFMEWKPVNSRLIKIRLRGKKITNIIQCYADTNNSDEEVKGILRAVQAELEEIPRHNMKIVMRDMNAKVGRDKTDHEKAMRRKGCGAINENGERLVELCTICTTMSSGEHSFHRKTFTS